METLKLKVNERILKRFMEMLNEFNAEDLQIIVEETDDVKRLKERFEELNLKDAKFISLEELDANLEKTISKYEN
jgi:hypothetical protein